MQYTKWTSQIFTEYSTQAADNILSIQHAMEQSPKTTTQWDTEKNLYKYKRIEIIPCILSDHSAIKLNINTRISPTLYKNTWRPNNTLLNNGWSRRNKEIKTFPELNEKDSTRQQHIWDTLKEVLRGKTTALSAYIKKQKEYK